jgi:hypothetical protein
MDLPRPTLGWAERVSEAAASASTIKPRFIAGEF